MTRDKRGKRTVSPSLGWHREAGSGLQGMVSQTGLPVLGKVTSPTGTGFLTGP